MESTHAGQLLLKQLIAAGGSITYNVHVGVRTFNDQVNLWDSTYEVIKDQITLAVSKDDVDAGVQLMSDIYATINCLSALMGDNIDSSAMRSYFKMPPPTPDMLFECIRCRAVTGEDPSEDEESILALLSDLFATCGTSITTMMQLNSTGVLAIYEPNPQATGIHLLVDYVEFISRTMADILYSNGNTVATQYYPKVNVKLGMLCVLLSKLCGDYRTNILINMLIDSVGNRTIIGWTNDEIRSYCSLSNNEMAALAAEIEKEQDPQVRIAKIQNGFSQYAFPFLGMLLFGHPYGLESAKVVHTMMLNYIKLPIDVISVLQELVSKAAGGVFGTRVIFTHNVAYSVLSSPEIKDIVNSFTTDHAEKLMSSLKEMKPPKVIYKQK